MTALRIYIHLDKTHYPVGHEYDEVNSMTPCIVVVGY